MAKKCDSNYEKLAQDKEVIPYSKFRAQMVEHIGHDDVSNKIIESLDKRTATSKMVWNSLRKNFSYWGTNSVYFLILMKLNEHFPLETIVFTALAAFIEKMVQRGVE